MRWFVDSSPLGSPSSPPAPPSARRSDGPTTRLVFEGSTWLDALRQTRAYRGEPPDVARFMVELIPDGYRAIDPVARVVFSIRPAPEGTPLSPSTPPSPAAVAPPALPPPRPRLNTQPFAGMMIPHGDQPAAALSPTAHADDVALSPTAHCSDVASAHGEGAAGRPPTEERAAESTPSPPRPRSQSKSELADADGRSAATDQGTTRASTLATEGMRPHAMPADEGMRHPAMAAHDGLVAGVVSANEGVTRGARDEPDDRPPSTVAYGDVPKRVGASAAQRAEPTAVAPREISASPVVVAPPSGRAWARNDASSRLGAGRTLAFGAVSAEQAEALLRPKGERSEAARTTNESSPAPTAPRADQTSPGPVGETQSVSEALAARAPVGSVPGGQAVVALLRALDVPAPQAAAARPASEHPPAYVVRRASERPPADASAMRRAIEPAPGALGARPATEPSSADTSREDPAPPRAPSARPAEPSVRPAAPSPQHLDPAAEGLAAAASAHDPRSPASPAERQTTDEAPFAPPSARPTSRPSISPALEEQLERAMRTSSESPPCPYEILFERREEPTAAAPLTYYELACAVAEGTTEATGERLLRSLLAGLRARLAGAPAGQFLNLAVFDVAFRGRPPRRPLVTLAWKDWRGPEPEVKFPLRSPSLRPAGSSPISSRTPGESLGQAVDSERPPRSSRPPVPPSVRDALMANDLGADPASLPAIEYAEAQSSDLLDDDALTPLMPPTRPPPPPSVRAAGRGATAAPAREIAPEATGVPARAHTSRPNADVGSGAIAASPDAESEDEAETQHDLSLAVGPRAPPAYSHADEVHTSSLVPSTLEEIPSTERHEAGAGADASEPPASVSSEVPSTQTPATLPSGVATATVDARPTAAGKASPSALMATMRSAPEPSRGLPGKASREGEAVAGVAAEPPIAAAAFGIAVQAGAGEGSGDADAEAPGQAAVEGTRGHLPDEASSEPAAGEAGASSTTVEEAANAPGVSEAAAEAGTEGEAGAARVASELAGATPAGAAGDPSAAGDSGAAVGPSAGGDSGAASDPSAVGKRDPAAPRANESGFELKLVGPEVAVSSTRLSGDELLSDLFDAMHELSFLGHPLDGADFVLSLAVSKLPSELALVHAFDIDRREFVVVRAFGAGAGGALLVRTPERDPLAAEAMARRRAVVVAKAAGDGRFGGARFASAGLRVTSAVVAPVAIGGRFLGLLELCNPRDGSVYRDGDGYALSYMGEQFAEFLGRVGLAFGDDDVREFRPSRVRPR